MSHSFLTVRGYFGRGEGYTFFEKLINGSGLGCRRGTSNPAVCASLTTERTDSQAWLANVSSIRQKGGSYCRIINERGQPSARTWVFFFSFFFFNKCEISEAATIIQACTPVHTTSHLQHRIGQESCDLWVALLF